MQFSNVTDDSGIIQEIDRICGTTNNSYSLKAKTARVNQALDRFMTLALMNDGEWQFDDVNQTDLPIGVTNLISGQVDYSFAQELLMVTKVLVKDNTGQFWEIPQVDQYEWPSYNIYAEPPGNVGLPNKYDIIANSILLDPIPNYDQEAGLKVVFKRNAVKFISTDTTQEPGIPSLFHPYLCVYASLPFLISKRLPNKNDVAAQITAFEDSIEDFMSDRDKTARTQIRPAWRSSR